MTNTSSKRNEVKLKGQGEKRIEDSKMGDGMRKEEGGGGGNGKMLTDNNRYTVVRMETECGE